MGGLCHPPRNSAQLLGGPAPPPSNPNVMRWWSPPERALIWFYLAIWRYLALSGGCRLISGRARPRAGAHRRGATGDWPGPPSVFHKAMI